MLSITRNIVVIVVGRSVHVLSTLQAQDAKIVADNLEFNREFYGGVHFSAIAESKPSFGYQRYPDNGPERIQCDQGTFARKQHEKSKESRAAAEKSPSPATQARDDESVADLVNRGIEKGKDGDLDGAIADFTRAIELDPKDDAPYYNRAQAEWLKKDSAGAIADYTQAIQLGSTNPAAYNNRGNARARNNDRDGAIADYTQAIQLKPDYARAYYNRAVAKKEKGDTAGAAADFKHAQQLDPELT